MIEADDDKVLRLHAEQLQVSRRRRPGETVRVRTVTTEHGQLVEEPLTHERVEVLRVPVGRVVDTVPEIRQEGDVTIMPVVEEQMIVQRRLVLKEEVHVRRVRTSTLHRETVILRQQEAVVTRIQAEIGQGHGPTGATETLSGED